jgi:hypothetical protein
MVRKTVIHGIVFLELFEEGGLNVGRVSFSSAGKTVQNGGSVLKSANQFDLRDVKFNRGLEEIFP